MQIIDLFSGIGGFSLAGRWAGWETVCFCEIDQWCRKVLNKNFPGVPIFDDIKELTYEKILGGTKWNPVRPTIVVGGFPCQPFSAAGKRQGRSDDRYLWHEMLRVIRETQPAYVVGENVAGLLSMENGRTLEGVLTDLEYEGYRVEVFVIPACGVGAWHRRDRAWICAYRPCANDKEFAKSSEDATDTQRTELKPNSNSRTGWNRFTDSCKDVSHTPSIGMEGSEADREQEPQTQIRPELPGCDCAGDGGKEGQFKSGLGLLADGIPSWVAEPVGVPRVATGIKDRVNKLKGLGNAVVPQVVYEIFKVIDQYEQNQRSLTGELSKPVKRLELAAINKKEA